MAVRKLKYLLLAGCLLLHKMFVSAQNVSPVVPDFTDITAPWVTATAGDTYNPFRNVGIVANRHQVITQQGKDYYTGNELNYLPSGESRVIKLGNEEVGGEAESITYHFVVDPERTVLLLKFAVVFVDPSHTLAEQPRFVVRIMDKEGNLTDACAEYDVSARAEIEGFQTCNKFNVPIRWRDWTNVGLDMSAFAGQEVQVQFVTYDCSRKGHFGYAYFTASCISHELSLTGCTGREFTVNAPEGFAAYRWQNGKTTPAITEQQTAEEMELACEVTSATGCRFVLSAHIMQEPVVPAEEICYDTICQGEEYHRHNYHLPLQDQVGTFVFPNTYFSLANCGQTGKTNLYLTVLQRYYPVEAEICPGESYLENGFSYLQPSSGLYLDTLVYSVKGRRCDSIVPLRLLVYPEISMTGGISGEKQFCVGTQQVYTLNESWEDGQYAWKFPKGFDILSGQGTRQVLVQVTDLAEPGEINLLYGKGACAAGVEPFLVEPYAAYWQTVTDTLCTGKEYHRNGFDVSVQDSAGFYTYSKSYSTMHGCDSVVTLNLYVFETPKLRIEVSDSILCGGKEVNLQAWSAKTRYISSGPRAIAVGDVYCTDGSIVKLKEYKTSGKKAEGIVFQVDDTQEHGWIVHLKDQSTSCRWGNTTQKISGLPVYVSTELAQKDTAGYGNTYKIRQAGTASVNEAAFLVDFNRGWYLPAAGQLLTLYGNMVEVNRSLAEVGGEVFIFDKSIWYYWTSTHGNVGEAYALEVRGRLMSGSKASIINLRAVRSF